MQPGTENTLVTTLMRAFLRIFYNTSTLKPLELKNSSEKKTPP